MVDIPVSVPVFPDYVDDVDDVLAAHPNTLGDELAALATMLGVIGVSQSKSLDFLDAVTNLILPTVKFSYSSTTAVAYSAGRCTPQNAGATQRVVRKNTSTGTITGSNLDAAGPSFAVSTDYYIYGVADAVATTFTFIISTNASTPSGPTIFQKLGGFSTNSAGEVIEKTIWSVAGMRIVDVQYAFDTTRKTTTTSFPSDNTIPQNTEGLEVVSMDHFVQKTTNIMICIGIAHVAFATSGISGSAFFSSKNGTPADAFAAGTGAYIITNETNISVLLAVRQEASVGKCSYAYRAGADNTASFQLNSNGSSASQIYGGVSSSGMIIIQLERGT